MILRAMVVLAMLTGAAWAAPPETAQPAPKYTPEIRGRLMRGTQPVTPSNVCLHRSETEVRQCGYVDYDGWFRIPSSGPMLPAEKAAGDQPAGAYPIVWLEIGTGLDATKYTKRLAPVRLVDDKTAVLRVDCDISRDEVGASNEPAYCSSPHAAAPGANAQSRR